MSEEQKVDLHQLIELLDAALTSQDANVQKALRKFLFIAALVLNNGTEREPGPIETLLNDLEARIRSLESDRWAKQPIGKDPYYAPPSTWPSPWTGTIPGVGGISYGSTGGYAGGTILTTDNTTNPTTASYIVALKDAMEELNKIGTAAAAPKL